MLLQPRSILVAFSVGVAAFFAGVCWTGAVLRQLRLESSRLESEWTRPSAAAAGLAAELKLEVDEARVRIETVAEIQRRFPEWLREAAMDQERRNRMRDVYQPLFSQLQLGPATREAVLRELVCIELTRERALDAARQSGLALDRPANRAVVIEAAIGGIDMWVREVLGPNGYRLYREYDVSAGWRMRLRPLVERLAQADEPLREPQTEALIRSLSQSSLGSASSGDQLFLPNSVIDAAAAILSPRQLQVMKLMQAEERWSRTMSRPDPGPPSQDGSGESRG